MGRRSVDRMMARGHAKEMNLGKTALHRALWLKAYLDEGSPTFLNAAASARRAGYRARKAHTFEQIGYKNRLKYCAKIVEWLDQCGMSETQLKIKLLLLMEARETVFQKLKGAVHQEDLLPGCRIVATSGTVITTKDGDVYGAGDTLLEIEVVALETQRRSLDMALKMRGFYAAEKVEHSGAVATNLELTDEDRALARNRIDQSAQKLMEESHRVSVG